VGDGSRILAVLEPRSNTMKLGAMKERLAESLLEADRVFCYDGGLDWDVADALVALGSRAFVRNDLEILVRAIVAETCPGDQVLVMSNGGFGGIHGRILSALAEKTSSRG
jgi:UDP-N-acetylmuramate: L-alanyl-gamma-D-glutamyl-meso-diaminopimelate ligase